MREGNGLRSFSRTRQGCVHPYSVMIESKQGRTAAAAADPRASPASASIEGIVAISRPPAPWAGMTHTKWIITRRFLREQATKRGEMDGKESQRPGMALTRGTAFRTPWSEGGAALWRESGNHAEDTVPHQRVTAKRHDGRAGQAPRAQGQAPRSGSSPGAEDRRRLFFWESRPRRLPGKASPPRTWDRLHWSGCQVPADREDTMTEPTPPRRFRVRIKTLLVAVVFVALVIVVIMQQVQIERMRRTLSQEVLRSRDLSQRLQYFEVNRSPAPPRPTTSTPGLQNGQPG